ASLRRRRGRACGPFSIGFAAIHFDGSTAALTARSVCTGVSVGTEHPGVTSRPRVPTSRMVLVIWLTISGGARCAAVASSTPPITALPDRLRPSASDGGVEKCDQLIALAG